MNLEIFIGEFSKIDSCTFAHFLGKEKISSEMKPHLKVAKSPEAYSIPFHILKSKPNLPLVDPNSFFLFFLKVGRN